MPTNPPTNPAHTLIPAPRTLLTHDTPTPAPHPLTPLTHLSPTTTLHTAPGTEPLAPLLRNTIGAATGLPLPGGAPTPDGIVLRLTPAVPAVPAVPAGTGNPTHPEGYRLTTDRSVENVAVLLESPTPAGLFRGIQTLRQLLGPEAFRRAPLRGAGQSWALPQVSVADEPRFAWRGLMLDVARHFMPKDGVLRYLDLIAAHKLNVFHFHLTDDQGWRIEIKRHPRLTDVGAWREPHQIGPPRVASVGREAARGLLHPGRHARDRRVRRRRHIRVVPEIEIPGHSQAAIAAYPELGNTDVIDTASLSVWDTWGVNPNVLAPTDTTSASTKACWRRCWSFSPRTSRRSSTSGATSAPRTSGRSRTSPRRGSASWARR